MLYVDPTTDRNNILKFIEEFFRETCGEEGILVESQEVMAVCLRMRTNFPYAHGDIDQASVFKKVANFAAHFLELRPIKYAPQDTMDECVYDINAVIALDIALACLDQSAIQLEDGGTTRVVHPIYISNHSYVDIIEALSSQHITQHTHYHLLAVFFEQLTYKTNPQCEYKDADPGDGCPGGYYSGAPSGWSGCR